MKRPPINERPNIRVKVGVKSDAEQDVITRISERILVATQNARGPKKLPSNVYRRSEERFNAELSCDIKQVCKSCHYVNQNYKETLKEKHTAALEKLKAEIFTHHEDKSKTEGSKIPPLTAIVPSPKQLEYRALAKLAVRPSDVDETESVIGLFEPESHNIVDALPCPLHTYAIKRFIRDLQPLLKDFAIKPYSEKTVSGDLRYLVVRSSHLTNELLITFVVTTPIKQQLRPLLSKLKLMGHKIASAYMNINQSTGNAIFGADTVHLSGAARLRERFCDFDLEVSPRSFLQVNPWQAIQLYRRIEQIVGHLSREEDANSPRIPVWDLYTGVGIIALMLARSGYRVLGIEETEDAIFDARDNAKRNRLGDFIEFLSGRTEDLIEKLPNWAQRPKLITVNPSRRGIADNVREKLVQVMKLIPDCRLLYISCDQDSLSRDLKTFTASGFRIRQIEAFDMFPQTNKIEWLVVVTS